MNLMSHQVCSLRTICLYLWTGTRTWKFQNACLSYLCNCQVIFTTLVVPRTVSFETLDQTFVQIYKWHLLGKIHWFYLLSILKNEWKKLQLLWTFVLDKSLFHVLFICVVYLKLYKTNWHLHFHCSF